MPIIRESGGLFILDSSEKLRGNPGIRKNEHFKSRLQNFHAQKCRTNFGVLLTNSPGRAIIKITSKYQGTQVSAERWVKREAGENPAQCRCCVSGVVFRTHWVAHPEKRKTAFDASVRRPACV